MATRTCRLGKAACSGESCRLPTADLLLFVQFGAKCTISTENLHPRHATHALLLPSHPHTSLLQVTLRHKEGGSLEVLAECAECRPQRRAWRIRKGGPDTAAQVEQLAC